MMVLTLVDQLVDWYRGGCWMLNLILWLVGRVVSLVVRGACEDNGYKASINGYKNGDGDTTSVGIPIK